MSKLLISSLIGVNVTGSVVFLLLAIASLITQKVFSARWHYISCKVCFLLYIIPVSRFIHINTDYINSQSQILGVTNIIKPLFDKTNLHSILSVIWTIGFIVYLGVNITNYYKVTKRLEYFDKYDKKLYNALDICKSNLNIRGKIMIMRNSEIKSPAVFGIKQPIIRIPEYVLSDEELSLILRHELIHYKRRDIIHKYVRCFISAVNWFNPLMHFLNKSTDRWSEMSCDQGVIKNIKKEERKCYGLVLLKIIEDVRNSKDLNSNKVSSGVALCDEGRYIKKRLNMMIHYKKRNALEVLMSLILLCFVTAVSIGAGLIPNLEYLSTSRSPIRDNKGDYVEQGDNEFMHNNQSVQANKKQEKDLYLNVHDKSGLYNKK